MPAPTAPGVMLMNLWPSHTDEELLTTMRTMKAAREAEAVTNIVALIDGYDDDPRELTDIPEVRAFARRLVDLGFIAFLDRIPSASPMLNGTLGGAELVWLAEGVPPPPAGVVPNHLVDMVNAALRRAVDAAFLALGPFTPRRVQS